HGGGRIDRSIYVAPDWLHQETEDRLRMFCKVLPWFLLALFATEIVAILMPKKEGEFHTREFARLPVLLNGRIQPLDSVARNALLQIRSTGDVPLEEVPSWKFWHHPKKLKATEWLLEVTTLPEQADDRPIFLIHHPDLLSELKLQDKGIEKSGLRYYTFNEIRSVGQEIIEQGQKAAEVKEELQTTYQKQVVKLAHAVFLYHNLKNSLRPEVSEDFAQELAGFRKDVSSLRAAARAGQTENDFDKETLGRVEEAYTHFRGMAQSGYLLNVPPLNPEVVRDEWHSAGRSIMESIGGDDFHPAVTFFAKMSTAYRQQKAEEFNQAVAGYRQWLEPQFAN